MTSKRSFQQREDEPWLAYPDSHSHSRDFSRSSSSMPHHDLHGQTVVSSPPSHPYTASSWTTPINHKRSVSKLNSSSSTAAAAPSSSTYSSTYSRGGGQDSFLYRSSFSPSSFGSRHRPPPPRTLSEELSMALQNPENSYPSPAVTPSALLSSPADLSSSALQSPTCSLSPTTAASTHFPLFKPSIPTSQQNNNNGSGGQRLRPSPLSLYPSNSSSVQYRSSNGGGGLVSPSSPFRSGSPTSALTRDTTTASDIAGSPRGASQAAAATLGASSSPKWPRTSPKGPPRQLSSSVFSDSAMSSSSYETEDFSTSPRRTKALSCSPLCQSGTYGRPQQHHPSCMYSHHPNASPDSPVSVVHHGPKPGRATKGIHRFGFPQFRPEIDEAHPGSDDPMSSAVTAATTRTASTSTGYGMPRGRRHEDDIDMDDDGDLGGLGRTYASEPPKKRMRSTASMLLDAAVETVIFTGAVALSAYQLLTGKGKLGASNGSSSNPTSGSSSAHHSKQASSASSLDIETRSREDLSKALDEDPMEEKLALVSDARRVFDVCVSTMLGKT